jgi:tetratricopeptide (TPR) repeat protein
MITLPMKSTGNRRHSYQRLFLGLLLAVPLDCFPGRAASAQNNQRLRSLSPLPSLKMSLEITTRELTHPEVRLGMNELGRQISALKKEPNQTPGDAGRYLQIGRYQEAVGRHDEAEESFAKAVPLFRLRAEARPQDAAIQVQFAEALQGAGKVEAAEHVLRAATRAVPDDWTCWTRLGEALDKKAFVSLSRGANNALLDQSFGSPISQMILPRPTPNQVKEAEECQAEAEKCFDRGVALGPKEVNPYLARALHRSVCAGLKRLLAQVRGHENPESSEIAELMFSREACDDLAKVARLSPTNYAAIAYWGWLEAAPALIRLKPNSGKAIDSLTGDRRKNVLESMRLLESLGNQANGAAAAGALVPLGILRVMVTDDLDGAKAAFRRAVALDPSRTQAWDGLVRAVAQSDDPQDLLSVCEERVKFADTARNRVALAKACDRAGLPDQAIDQARQAVRLAPKDPVAHLCAGALLLRRFPDENTAAEMKEHLFTAHQLLGERLREETDNDDEFYALVINHGLNMAVLMALEGNEEIARQALHKLAGMEAKLAGMEAANDEVKDRIKEIETAIGK